MERWRCSYLDVEVELTDERERHIRERHPELLPRHRDRIAETLADPDQIRKSGRASNARLFSRWFDSLMGGKRVVVVVVSEAERHWLLSAYVAQKLAKGDGGMGEKLK